MKYLRHYWTIILPITICFSTSTAFAVAINSDVGLTPHKDQLLIRSQARFTRKNSDPTSKERDLRALFVPTTFVYGHTDKLAGILTVPWVDKELRSTKGPSRIKSETSGLGDITYLSKYRIWTDDALGSTRRLSVLGGIELPTGNTNDGDDSGKFSRDFQIGSGSWDPQLGLAYTYQTLDEEWDLNVTHQFNTESRDYEFGDVFKYNIAYQIRVLPMDLPDQGLYDQLNFVLELNGQWVGKSKDSSGDVEDSGGNIVYLSPGIQIASKRYVMEVAVQLPILQELNGLQNETDYSAVGSIRVTF